jgi:lipopolysaccharide biosynthesis glycosyltransferase
MADKQPLAVACAGNAAYALPMTVMLTSLVCNLKSGRDLDIYIIESDIPTELQQKMETSIRQNKQGAYRLDIHWFKLDKALLQNLPVAGHVNHITLEAYARFLVPDLLPADCPRVVYLDCDLVVLKDIAALYDALDDQHTVAAVANVFLPYVSSHFFYTTDTVVFDHAARGIPADTRYFQSGVMVINLPRWKEQNVTARIIEYLETNRDKVYFHDQGALNAILWDQWLRLDQRWNQTTTVLTPRHWKSPAYTAAERRRTRDNPFIVHYTGRDKPWHPGFRRPRSSFFYRYFKKTLFKDELKISPLEFIIGFKCYYLIWKTKDRLRLLVSRLKSAPQSPPSGE